MVHEHRDRVYIRKDIILNLSEYGELNQSRLLGYCGLNTIRHKEILDYMVSKRILVKSEEPHGNKTIIKYRVSENGKELLKQIQEPYEQIFPRSDKNANQDFIQLALVKHLLSI